MINYNITSVSFSGPLNGESLFLVSVLKGLYQSVLINLMSLSNFSFVSSILNFECLDDFSGVQTIGNCDVGSTRTDSSTFSLKFSWTSMYSFSFVWLIIGINGLAKVISSVSTNLIKITYYFWEYGQSKLLYLSKSQDTSYLYFEINKNFRLESVITQLHLSTQSSSLTVIFYFYIPVH